MDAACDHALYIACFLSELLSDASYRASQSAGQSLIAVKPVTDCKSLFDASKRLAQSLQEKRVQIDISSIREAASDGEIRWVPTTEMKADGLTKRSTQLRLELAEFCNDPKFCLVEQEPTPDKAEGDSGMLTTPSSTLHSGCLSYEVCD